MSGVRELDRLVSLHARGMMTREELAAEIAEWVARRHPDGIRTASRHPDPVVREALVGVFRFPAAGPGHEVLQALTRDESAEVRAAATRMVDDLTDRHDRELEREDLLGNGYEIRFVLSRMRLSRRLVNELLAEDDPHTVAQLAGNPHLPAEVVAGLVAHPDPEVRRRLAGRGDLTAEQLLRLSADP
ncbi:hypothetical protein [Actinoplanes sp. URMC 104]|uniref:hypothetical protein n=1 Tax=Actinoplanes sp. URMC 104 TaxID=3423409 RepID=UPI003F1AE856